MEPEPNDVIGLCCGGLEASGGRSDFRFRPCVLSDMKPRVRGMKGVNVKSGCPWVFLPGQELELILM
jgi:hypothetical protein